MTENLFDITLYRENNIFFFSSKIPTTLQFQKRKSFPFILWRIFRIKKKFEYFSAHTSFGYAQSLYFYIHTYVYRIYYILFSYIEKLERKHRDVK